MTKQISAETVLELLQGFTALGVTVWLDGGWGVDALLGRVTREHKDLDLLVLISDLPRYAEVVKQQGFKRKLEWSESQPI